MNVQARVLNTSNMDYETPDQADMSLNWLGEQENCGSRISDLGH